MDPKTLITLPETLRRTIAAHLEDASDAVAGSIEDFHTQRRQAAHARAGLAHTSHTSGRPIKSKLKAPKAPRSKRRRRKRTRAQTAPDAPRLTDERREIAVDVAELERLGLERVTLDARVADRLERLEIEMLEPGFPSTRELLEEVRHKILADLSSPVSGPLLAGQGEEE